MALITIDEEQLTQLLESQGFQRKRDVEVVAESSASKRIFSDAGVVGDGKSDDTDALQNAVNTCLAEYENIVFPPGRYKVSDTIHFVCPDLDRVSIFGFRASIIANFSGVHDVGAPEDYSDKTEEWKAIRESPYKPMIKVHRGDQGEWQTHMAGFQFEGEGKIGVIGLEVRGITQSTFSDMTALNCWVGTRATGWNNTWHNITTKNGYIGQWLTTGSLSGCKEGSNQISIQNCRHFGAQGPWNNFKVLPYAAFAGEGRGLTYRECTMEGKFTRYGVLVQQTGNCTGENILHKFHVEMQEWGQISKQDHYSVALCDMRDTLYFEKWVPRYGMINFGQTSGLIVVRGAPTVSAKSSQAPAPWKNVPRNIFFVDAVADNWNGKEDAETYAAYLARQNEKGGKFRATFVVNGMRSYASITV